MYVTTYVANKLCVASSFMFLNPTPSALPEGDVGLVKMGIDDDDYTYLCTDIDYVIHAAAYVNLIYPYQVCNEPSH